MYLYFFVLNQFYMELNMVHMEPDIVFFVEPNRLLVHCSLLLTYFMNPIATL